MKGSVKLQAKRLKQERLYRGLSQERLSQQFYDLNIQVSIATLKRAEAGKNVNYRIAKELANFYKIPISELIIDNQSSQEYQLEPSLTQRCHYIFSVLVTSNSEQHEFTGQHAILISQLVQTIDKIDFHVLDVIGNYFTGICWSDDESYIIKRLCNFQQLISSRLPHCHMSFCVSNSQLTITANQTYQVNDHVIERMIFALQRSMPNSFLVDSSLRRALGAEYLFNKAQLETSQNNDYWQLTPKYSNPLPIYGREYEINQFKEVFSIHQDKKQSFLLAFTGPPGIGKTHLCEYLLNLSTSISSTPINSLSICCKPSLSLRQDTLIYQLIINLSRSNDISNHRGLNRQKQIENKLSTEENTFINQLILNNESAYHHQDTHPTINYNFIVSLLVKLIQFQNISQILIDDIHHANNEHLTILFECLSHLQQPILVLTCYNPAIVEPATFPFRIVKFALEPLSQEADEQLASYLLPHNKGIQDNCRHAARGNPLLLKKLLLNYNNQQVVSSSFLDILSQRLQQLPAKYRQLLCYAALYGQAIDIAVMHELIPDSRKYLSYLEDCNFLVRFDSQSYLFSQPEIADKAKQLAPVTQRFQIHQEIIDAVLNVNFNQPTKKFQILAYHYYAQKKYAQAIDAYYQAALQNKELGQYDETLANLYKALDIFTLQPDPIKEIDLRLMINPYLVTRYGWSSPPVKQNFNSISFLCENIPNTSALASILFHRWSDNLLSLKLQDSLEVAKELKNQSKATGDHCAEVQAYVAICNSSYWLGELENCIANGKKALALYSSTFQQRELTEFGQDSRILATVFTALAYSLYGDQKQVSILLNNLNILKQKINNPLSEVMALQANVFIAYHEQRSCQSHAQVLLELATKYSIPFFIGAAKLFLGWSQAIDGDTKNGSILMDEGYNQWMAKSGSKMGHSLFVCMKTETLILDGKYDSAINTVNTSLAIAKFNHERVYLSRLYQLKSAVESKLNYPLEQVEASKQQALKVATQQKISCFIKTRNNLSSANLKH